MSGEFRFRTAVKVRYNEVDMQGHVNFANYYFYFDIGLTEYLAAIGYDYSRMLADGQDMLYIESHCNHKSPARWPETLWINTRVAEMRNRGLRFEFEARAEQDDRLVATGHIVAVTTRREGLTPCPIPDRLRDAVLAYEGEKALSKG